MNPIETTYLQGTTIPTEPAVSLESGFDSSLTSDISLFEANLDQAATRPLEDNNESIAKAIIEPFNRLNTEATELAEFAANASNDGDSFTPGEIVKLTYKAQEFGFHSQLTANIANRLADGIQQLFRQQG